MGSYVNISSGTCASNGLQTIVDVMNVEKPCPQDTNSIPRPMICISHTGALDTGMQVWSHTETNQDASSSTQSSETRFCFARTQIGVKCPDGFTSDGGVNAKCFRANLKCDVGYGLEVETRNSGDQGCDNWLSPKECEAVAIGLGKRFENWQNYGMSQYGCFYHQMADMVVHGGSERTLLLVPTSLVACLENVLQSTVHEMRGPIHI